MNYHLQHKGQNLGIFSLEQLHERRVRGELTGNEAVLGEGTTNWQMLDSVLQQKTSFVRPVPPPIPPPSAKTDRTVMWVVAGAIVLFVVLLVAAAAPLSKMVKQLASIYSRSLPANIPVRNYQARNDAALEAASKPVIAGDNAMTEAQMQKKRREFRSRQYFDGYKLRGDQNPACDTDCIGFIGNWIAGNYGGVVDPIFPPVSELADRLANNPSCTDAIVLTIAGVECTEQREATRRLERALTAFENSRHKAYPKFYAAVMLNTKLGYNSPRQFALDAVALQRFKEMLQDGSLQPEDQADIAESLTSNWGYYFFYRNAPKMISLTKDAGKSYEWLALVLEGKYQIEEAWKARGGGYANTVTAAGWKGFREHLALAGECFSKAWKLRPDLPLAPAQMMTVALGQSDIKDMRRWFDRAVTAQIDYPSAWSAMIWGLRPRWYGDRNSMLAFGITALNTRRYDTDIPRKFFDVVTDLETDEELPAGEHIYGREDIWPHLREMYEGYIATPSQSPFRYGWRSSYIGVAYFAGKYDVARKQLEAVNWQPWNLTGWNKDLSLLPLEVAARTGNLGRQISEAEEHREDGEIANALQTYSELSAATNADERTSLFIQDRQITLGIEQSLQKGEWVDFLPTRTNFSGWCVARGNCRLLPDGALEVQSDKNGHMLFCRADVGNNFEVKGQFEVVHSSTKSFQAGLIMGLPEFDSSTWYGFRIKRNGEENEQASFSDRWSKNQRTHTAKLGETNIFTFRFASNKVSATVNDEEVFREINPPKSAHVPTNGFLLGLGAFNNMNDTMIRYRNLQVRKLAAH